MIFTICINHIYNITQNNLPTIIGNDTETLPPQLGNIEDMNIDNLAHVGQPIARGSCKNFLSDLSSIIWTLSINSIKTYQTDNTTNVHTYPHHKTLPFLPQILKKVPPFKSSTSSMANQHAITPHPTKIYHN